METYRVAGGGGVIGGLTGHAHRNPGEAAILCEHSATRCLIQNGRFISYSTLAIPLQLLVKTHQAEATGCLNSHLVASQRPAAVAG